MARKPFDAAFFILFAPFVRLISRSVPLYPSFPSFRYTRSHASSSFRFSLRPLTAIASTTCLLATLPAFSCDTLFLVRFFVKDTFVETIRSFLFYSLYFHSSLFHLPFGSCPFLPRPRRKEGPLESRSPRNSSFLAFRSTYDRVVRLFIAPRPTKRRRNSLSVAEHRRRVILLFRSRRMHRFCSGCRHIAMPTRPPPKVILFSLLYRFVNACATLSGNEVRVERNLTRRQRVSRGQRVSPLSNPLFARIYPRAFDEPVRQTNCEILYERTNVSALRLQPRVLHPPPPQSSSIFLTFPALSSPIFLEKTLRAKVFSELPLPL